MTFCKYLTVVAFLACASVAVAQNTTQRTVRDQTGQAGQVGQTGRLGTAGQGGDMDTLIASCLLIANEEEIALAKMAADKAEHQEVKQFAQMLVNEHQKAVQDLQQHAKPGIGLNAAGGGAASNQSGAANSVTMDNILQLQQQAAQECLSMTKSMLQEKQGAEFDKAFSGMQVGAHIGMLAKLKASKNQASPELASWIDRSMETMQDHLAKAKELCMKLEDSDMRQARGN